MIRKFSELPILLQIDQIVLDLIPANGGLWRQGILTILFLNP
jgi:hypothetical protein